MNYSFVQITFTYFLNCKSCALLIYLIIISQSQFLESLQSYSMQIKKEIRAIFQKPFVFIQSQKQFKKIKSDIVLFPSQANYRESIEKNKKQKLKNSDIVIPRFEKLQQDKIIPHKKLANKIQHSGYFRLKQQHILPKADSIQLTDQDFTFIDIVLKKKYFSYNFQLRPNQIADIFACLQKNYYNKNINLNSKLKHIISLLQFKISSQIDSYSLQQKVMFKKTLEEIIHYWKNKKKFLRFPLNRINWPRTEETMRKYPFCIPYKKRTVKYSRLSNLGQDMQMKLLLNRPKPNQRKVKQVLGNIQQEFKQYQQISIIHNHQRNVFESQMRQFYQNCNELPFKLQIPQFFCQKLKLNQLKSNNNEINTRFQNVKFKYLRNHGFLKKSRYSQRIFKLVYDKTPFINVSQRKFKCSTQVFMCQQKGFQQGIREQLSSKMKQPFGIQYQNTNEKNKIQQK